VVKDRMSTLYTKGETFNLVDAELVELHELSDNLHSLSRVQSSMCWQRARLNWLHEGDANTKNFHIVMSSRRWCNAIQTIQVIDAQVEGAQNIRENVFNHFSSHFKAVIVDMPGVEDLEFHRLFVVEPTPLIQPFTLGEIKQVIWDCDSFKSPRPDGISFGFIKQLWVEVKDDFMRFMTEFHRN